MIDRHAVHALLKAGQTTQGIALQLGVTQRTIQRIAREPPVEQADDAEARRRRAVGRPAIPEEVRARLRELLAADPEAPPLEFLRQLREEGTPLGESTFYRVLRLEKEKVPSELMVRFEGVAGEFAQFDFGQSDVRLLDGRKQRIHFAAYRLKYSRWVWIVIVPDERIESLIRALLLCFEHGGGVPLRVVFDNPKTVVLGRDEHGRPRWNQTLAQVAIDFGFTIELCAPRSPEQKGAVENLVGWVKQAFFRARRFADLDHDLPRQLLEGLIVVNEERPSRATRVIPAERLVAEKERMKPLAVPSAEYGLRFPVQVGPTALVDFQGIRYAMPAGACGIPATLHLYPDRARISTAGGRFEATHPRFPKVGKTSYLEGQRAEQLAAVAGARKRLYFVRERLLELGPVGEGYLTELIHARPFTWKADIEQLFMLWCAPRLEWTPGEVSLNLNRRSRDGGNRTGCRWASALHAGVQEAADRAYPAWGTHAR
jgi:transposase